MSEPIEAIPGARVYWGGVHSQDCWSVHPECALSAAVSYLTARIAHDQARVGLYRRATGGVVTGELRDEAVDLARQLLMENSERDWSKAG